MDEQLTLLQPSYFQLIFLFEFEIENMNKLPQILFAPHQQINYVSTLGILSKLIHPNPSKLFS